MGGLTTKMAGRLAWYVLFATEGSYRVVPGTPGYVTKSSHRPLFSVNLPLPTLSDPTTPTLGSSGKG